VWVGFPNDRTPMTGLYHGYANVDGGTYPADIWRTYMSMARGGYCGDFPLPEEPFQAQPFYGKYSRNGIRGESGSASQYPSTGYDPANPASPTTPTTPTAPPSPPSTGGGTGGTGGGGGFDPGKYETPPQGPPTTKAPPGAGTGGTTPGGTG
jgi:penicillin-binding protein 1A